MNVIVGQRGGVCLIREASQLHTTAVVTKRLGQACATREQQARNDGAKVLHFLAQRKAHPPLGAAAEVYHGVEVVVMENHRNRTAPSGRMMRLVRLIVIP